MPGGRGGRNYGGGGGGNSGWSDGGPGGGNGGFNDYRGGGGGGYDGGGGRGGGYDNQYRGGGRGRGNNNYQQGFNNNYQQGTSNNRFQQPPSPPPYPKGDDLAAHLHIRNELERPHNFDPQTLAKWGKPLWLLSCYCAKPPPPTSPGGPSHAQGHDLTGDVSPEEGRWLDYQDRAAGKGGLLLAAGLRGALQAKEQEVQQLIQRARKGSDRQLPSFGGPGIKVSNAWIDRAVGGAATSTPPSGFNMSAPIQGFPMAAGASAGAQAMQPAAGFAPPAAAFAQPAVVGGGGFMRAAGGGVGFPARLPVGSAHGYPQPAFATSPFPGPPATGFINTGGGGFIKAAAATGAAPTTLFGQAVPTAQMSSTFNQPPSPQPFAASTIPSANAGFIGANGAAGGFANTSGFATSGGFANTGGFATIGGFTTSGGFANTGVQGQGLAGGSLFAPPAGGGSAAAGLLGGVAAGPAVGGLSDEETLAYRSAHFTKGKVPETPPPPELCQ